jgi:tetratricopeptide (TPR) repeat protein
MADIFVSYTSSDREWAFWVAKELQALGHVAHIHEWEIKGGDDIYAWMEERHDAADHVLCVVSDDYLRAPYSTLERNAALWQAAAKRPGFVLFVAVGPCRLPTLSDHVRRCELFGVPEDAARLRLREFMQKRGAPAAAMFPGKVFAVSNIPIRVPEHFLGRDDSLAGVALALKRYEGRVAITALHGLRGVGKTTLAAAYADRHRNDYRVTWWIRAQTSSTIRSDLIGLGVRLTWVAADEKEEPALAVVMERIRHEGDGVLLIYDNAPDADALREYLPRGGTARVLVTSNAHTWRGVAEPLEIRLWPKEIGADYLVARTARAAERDAAEALSDALAGLPLAHEQAAAYCEDLGIGLGEYKRRFDAAAVEFLDRPEYVPAEYHPEHAAEHRDRLTTAGTFRLAIEEAAKRHPAAKPFIAHVALLPSEPVPLFLFTEAKEKFSEPLATALAGEGLDKIIAALRAFALIERVDIPDERNPAVTTDCIRVHRLVRQVAAGRREDDPTDGVLQALIEAIVAVYPANVWRDPDTWSRIRRLDPLALPLALSDAVPPGAEKRIGDLLIFAGQYRHYALAAYGQARPLYERALTIREKTAGLDHPDTATSINNLAALLQDEGELAKARPLYERALAIRQQALGPEHPDTAESLNNLALLMQRQGDLTGALPLFQRGLTIREKVFGPEHPGTATGLNNLAFVMQGQGDFAGARPLHERALAIREKVFGSEHPHTAMSVNNLAAVLQNQGDFAGARRLYERAVAIFERVLGAEHPNTHRSRRNFATLLLATEDLDDALALGQAALAGHEKVLGPGHFWTKEAAHTVAEALGALGRHAEAASLRERYN